MLDRKEKDRRINIIVDKIVKELRVNELFDNENLDNFKSRIYGSLKKNNYLSFIEKNYNEFDEIFRKTINFYKNLGMTKLDIIESLNNSCRLFDIIQDKEFLDKYKFLSIIEDKNNSIRKRVLKENPAFFDKSLEELYIRYVLLTNSNLTLGVTSMLGETFTSFSKKFVKTRYVSYNSYKFLTEPMTLEKFKEYILKSKKYKDGNYLKLLNNNFLNVYPVNDKIKEEIINLPINDNISFYNKDYTTEEKTWLAFNNYYKVKNLGQLVAITDIPRETLRNHLKSLSKRFPQIDEWLLRAKEEGNKVGGVNSQANNGYEKDPETGHFKGAGKK